MAEADEQELENFDKEQKKKGRAHTLREKLAKTRGHKTPPAMPPPTEPAMPEPEFASPQEIPQVSHTPTPEYAEPPKDPQNPIPEVRVMAKGPLYPISKTTTPPAPIEDGRDTLYLYGGMTTPENWQAEFLQWLKPYGLQICDPKRWGEKHLMSKGEPEEQRAWENEAFKKANRFVFWWPDQLSHYPIAWFTLGRAIEKAKLDEKVKLYVGFHPAALRTEDIAEWTRVAYGKGIEIHQSLRNLAIAVIGDVRAAYGI